jgi:hypothetical protein
MLWLLCLLRVNMATLLPWLNLGTPLHFLRDFVCIAPLLVPMFWDCLWFSDEVGWPEPSEDDAVGMMAWLHQGAHLRWCSELGALRLRKLTRLLQSSSFPRHLFMVLSKSALGWLKDLVREHPLLQHLHSAFLDAPVPGALAATSTSGASPPDLDIRGTLASMEADLPLVPVHLHWESWAASPALSHQAILELTLVNRATSAGGMIIPGTLEYLQSLVDNNSEEDLVAQWEALGYQANLRELY